METYPDFHLETWNGFFAPRGAPDGVAEKRVGRISSA